MTVNGAVANPANISNPDNTELYGLLYGKAGETVFSRLHGNYYLGNYRGNVFSLNTQATAVTTSAALATTWLGVGIYNPVGSGVNAAILQFSCSQFAVGAAAAVGLLGSATPTATWVNTTAATTYSRIIGNTNTSRVIGSTAATISTPLVIATYGSVGSVATTAYGLNQGIFVDVAGAVIVPPGSFVGTYTSIATTTALNFGLVWEEVLL